MNESIIQYDIAAVAIMLIATASVLRHRVKRGRAYHAYLVLILLITLTSFAEMCQELYDSLASILSSGGPAGTALPLIPRDVLHITYFLLRNLNAPAYLIFIAAISETTHRLFRNLGMRFALWGPVVFMTVFILANPIHHGIYTYEQGYWQRGPFIWLLYLTALYYSLWGIEFLIRWRTVLGRDKFRALMSLYPINLLAVLAQLFAPYLRVEMFFTSVAVLFLAEFVIRPEDEIDRLVDTLSLHAYEEMCRRAFLTERPLCLVYIDVANKERLRELSGAGAFHQIVRAVSMQTSTYLRRGDVLYYLRNGLFCISAHNPDAVRALGIAQQSSREGREAADKLPEQSMVVQLRTCVVRVPDDVHDADTLHTFTRRIGHLMPEPCVTTYEQLSRSKDFSLMMNLANIVSQAITDRSFEVHYQPIYCVEDGCFHSAEALIRLNDPTFGFISPALFIPEAEVSGAILDIGQITLEKIFQFLGKVDFATTDLDYVEVNLSVDQCIRPELSREVLELMDRNKVSADRINFEITETSASYSQAAIDANVRALAKHGIAFSMDDYGTGYSNLSRMLTLPFNLIKLDKTLVDAMDDPATNTVLANTIVTMKEIGKKVLVEGVETAEQAQQLIEMGVDYIQGYLYSRPLSETDFTSFLLEHNHAE